MYSLDEYSRLSINDQARIEEACLRYEQQWQQGKSPSLDAAIEQWSDQQRFVLLQELLQIEIHYRGYSNEPHVDLSAICDLYPRIADEIRLALQTNDPQSVTFISPRSSEKSDDDVATANQRQIGNYFLVEKIGQGGMGSVWLAEQREPIRRQIALKLIKPGLESKDINARFQAERQSLAMMNHPNIAKVLEVGTDAGRPFMAMELVDGSPIVDYCRQEHLDVRQRLHLFIDVCRAVGHAHKKGIIHRDIKPSNVLVTESDEKPIPKVIDFGLAKALDRKLDDVSWSTQMHSFVGTLPYMSPEQTDPELQNIDIRSDIYSLGVLLYELLTGSRPIQINQSSYKTLQETIAAIREEDPDLPSRRVKEIGDSDDSICRQLSTHPHRLSQQLSGDLDSITSKAMQKNQQLRYQNTDELADDIDRFLNDQPVTAHPSSTTYRVSKFYRRHRIAVTAAALVLILLVAGVVGTSLGMAWAIQNEKEATKLALKERAAKELANQRLTHAQNSRQILASIFTGIDPFGPEKAQRNLREDLAIRLDAAESQLTTAPVGGPVDIAEMQALLGKAQYGLGNYDDAIRILEQAVSIFESELGPLSEQALTSRIVIGLSKRDSGNSEAASQTLRNILHSLEKPADEGSAIPAIKATVQMALAALYQQAGDFEQAAYFEKQAEQTTSKDFSTELELLGRLQVQLENQKGIRLKQQSEYARAKPYFERSVQLSQKYFGARHPNTLSVRTNLAIIYQVTGQTSKAIELFEDVLQIQTRQMGRRHAATLRTQNNLATALAAQEDFQRAETILLEIEPVLKETLGENHSDYLLAVSNLAAIYRRTKRYGKSIKTYESVIESMQDVFGESHYETMNMTLGFAKAYQESGDIDKALPLLESWWRAAEKNLPVLDSARYSGLYALSSIYRQREQHQEVVDLLSGEINNARNTMGPASPSTVNLEIILANCCYQLEKYEQSLPHYEAVLKYCRDRYGDDHSQTINALYNFAAAQLAAGRIEQGTQSLEKSHQSFIKLPNVTTAEKLESRLMIANLLREAQQYQQAEQMLRTAIEKHQSSLPQVPVIDARMHAWLGWTIAQSVLKDDGKKKLDEEFNIDFTESENERLNEAEKLLLSSYQKLEQVARQTDPPSNQAKNINGEIRSVANALKRLYLQTDRPDQAKKWADTAKQFSD